MNVDRLLPLLVSLTLAVASCGGSGDGAGGSDASAGAAGAGAAGAGAAGAGAAGARAAGARAAAALPQPPEGVPAGIRPLPVPEYGKAYNNPQPRSNVVDGGTLTLPIGGLGPNFNRFNVDGNLVQVSTVLRWLSPRLWNFSVAGDVSPNEDYLLSYELVSEEPETVKYTLNPNAKWNDGTPIDWTAFETVWKTSNGTDERFNPAATTGYESIASVVKGEKDNEVIVTFKEPFYPIEYLFLDLAHPRNADPDFYKTGWLNQIHNDLLAGPFVVESLTEERVVLVRNPKWWGDTAKLERVVYRQMELAASINAFQNGEIDATNVAIADRLKQISGMQNIQIRRGFETRTVVYILGRDSALFRDDAARKAFMLGTDRRLLASIDFQGLDWEEEPPGSSVTYTWQQGYRDNMPDLHYDPVQAREVLDAAGWKVGEDGFRHKDGRVAEFTYVDFGDDPILAAQARAQQQMSKQIGLLMNIDIRSAADFAPTMTNRSFDVLIMAWTATDPFGYSNVCQLFCSDSESNFSGLGNPELDELLRMPGRISDRSKAIEAANAAEEKSLHLYGMLPLSNGPRMVAVKAGLANQGPAGFLVPAPEDVGWQRGSPFAPEAE